MRIHPRGPRKPVLASRDRSEAGGEQARRSKSARSPGSLLWFVGPGVEMGKKGADAAAVHRGDTGTIALARLTIRAGQPTRMSCRGWAREPAIETNHCKASAAPAPPLDPRVRVACLGRPWPGRVRLDDWNLVRRPRHGAQPKPGGKSFGRGRACQADRDEQRGPDPTGIRNPFGTATRVYSQPSSNTTGALPPHVALHHRCRSQCGLREEQNNLHSWPVNPKNRTTGARQTEGVVRQ